MLFSFRIDDETLARWRAAARDRGVPLASIIRQSVEREIGVESVRVTRGDVEIRPAAVVGEIVRQGVAERRCQRASRHVKGVRCAYCQTTP